MLSSARLLISRCSFSISHRHNHDCNSFHVAGETVREWLQHLQCIDPMRRCFYDHMAACLPMQMQMRADRNEVRRTGDGTVRRAEGCVLPSRAPACPPVVVS